MVEKLLGQLSVLPVELLVVTLEFLDPRSILKCREACTTLQKLIDSFPSLQLTIDLYSSGQTNTYRLPPPSCLDALRKHEQAWGELRWKAEMRFPLLDGDLWELSGGVIALNDEEGHFQFRRLPSICRTIDEKVWMLGPFDFGVRDFGMDPAQDLLILIERPEWQGIPPSRCIQHFHLHRMSTGAPHPNARETVISYTFTIPHVHITYSIQICGDYFCILIDCMEVGSELCVWNWKNGKIETVLYGEGIRSFAFLTDRYILLAVLTLSEGFDLVPELLMLDFRNETEDRHPIKEIQHAYIFHFPLLDEDVRPYRFEIRSDPPPNWSPSSDARVPFFVSADRRIYVISLWLITDSRATCITLCAPPSTFFSCIQNKDGDTFDWPDWGPAGTRLLQLLPAPSDIWVCYVYASRFVSLRKNGRQFAIDVYDFHKPTVLREAGRVDSTENEMTFVTKPTKYEGGEIFVEDIETFLPYRLQTLPMRMKLSEDISVMCSEDGILIVDASLDHRELRLLTF